jgi:hypothetical protein
MRRFHDGGWGQPSEHFTIDVRNENYFLSGKHIFLRRGLTAAPHQAASNLGWREMR